MSRSTYYFEIHRISNGITKNKDLIEQIKDIYTRHKGNYGVRRITHYLNANSFIVNHKKVQRIMKLIGLKGRTPKRQYHSFQGHEGASATNLINRNFYSELPNQKWSTDVSQFSLPFGKCYLSPILDMADGYIVAYDLSMNPDFKQIERMLFRAFETRKELTGLVLHSDMGWQYNNPRYIRILKDKKITQSMSRKGNCFDNCIIESFFGHMKNEMFYDHETEFKSFKMFSKAVDEYIRYYNEERLNSKCKYLSPKNYHRVLLNYK